MTPASLLAQLTDAAQSVPPARMTPLDVLRGARELLAKPEAWTKGAWARDVAGDYCASTDVDACCWCISGAMRKASNGDNGARREAKEAVRTANPLGYISFNDDPKTTHADVLDLLDRAIAGLSE